MASWGYSSRLHANLRDTGPIWDFLFRVCISGHAYRPQLAKRGSRCSKLRRTSQMHSTVSGRSGIPSHRSINPTPNFLPLYPPSSATHLAELVGVQIHNSSAPWFAAIGGAASSPSPGSGQVSAQQAVTIWGFTSPGRRKHHSTSTTGLKHRPALSRNASSWDAFDLRVASPRGI